MMQTIIQLSASNLYYYDAQCCFSVFFLHGFDLFVAFPLVLFSPRSIWADSRLSIGLRARPLALFCHEQSN